MEEINKDPRQPNPHQMPPGGFMHGPGCPCPWCRGYGRGGWGFLVARVLLAIVVLLFVFWLGVKTGEIKSFMGGYYGGYGYGRGMMGSGMGGGMRTLPYRTNGMPSNSSTTPSSGSSMMQ